MKIAFVSLNREKLPDPVVPLGLLYVMASTPPGHARELWDLCFERDPHAALRARARAFAPDLVAVGMRNVQSADYSGVADNLREYAALIATLRECTAAPIVLGGGGFSVMPRELMLALRPDYGIAGEGERAFPALVDALANGGLERIAGLLYFEGDALREVPRAPDFQRLDALAPPERDAIDPRYYARCGTDSVQTKRGCPMACTYCTYPQIEGRLSRQRSPERVADELEDLARRRAARHVFIVDSTFNLPLSHAKAVCRAMIARGLSLPWTCYVNPIAFDEELAELMARAGCAGMEVGTDSGDDAVLAALQKGFTTRHVRALSARARAAELRDCHTFVLATPGETLDSVRRSLDFVVELDPFAAILMVWTDDHEAVDPSLVPARRALREATLALLEDHHPRFERWIIPALGVRFDARLFRALRASGAAGPLWQHVA